MAWIGVCRSVFGSGTISIWHVLAAELQGQKVEDAYLDFFLAETNLIDDHSSFLFAGLGVGLVGRFQNGMVLRTSYGQWEDIFTLLSELT